MKQNRKFQFRIRALKGGYKSAVTENLLLTIKDEFDCKIIVKFELH
jgi:hypothetical protein